MNLFSDLKWFKVPRNKRKSKLHINFLEKMHPIVSREKTSKLIKQLGDQTNWLNVIYSASIQAVVGRLVKNSFILATFFVLKTSIKELFSLSLFMKAHSLSRFSQLIDIATEDAPKRKNRFRVNYILSSFGYSNKLIITLVVRELQYIPSLASLFSSAGWLEREVWDLYGVYFSGNTDLRRILTDYGFSGHPLRKDFPLSGFSEIYYSLEQNRIVVVPIELAQAYRVFIV